MRTTKLMDLCYKMGDRGVALLQSRYIHPVIYQMAEIGEASFGPALIQHLREDLPHTANPLVRNAELLNVIADRFFRFHLIPAVRQHAPEFSQLPALSSATYIEYFSKISELERAVRGSGLAPACMSATTVLTAYSTESSYPLLSGVADFFRLTNNQAGFEELMIEVCGIAKKLTEGNTS